MQELTEALLRSGAGHDLYVAVDAGAMASAEVLRKHFLAQLLPGHFVSWTAPDAESLTVASACQTLLASAMRDMALRALLPDIVIQTGRASAEDFIGLDAAQIASMTADPQNAWRTLADACPVSAQAKSGLRVAIISAAEYGERYRAALQRHLPADAVIDLFTETGMPGDAVLPHAELGGRYGRYAGVVYHLDNRPGNAFMLPTLEQCPGLLVLYDARLDQPYAELAVRLAAPQLVLREHLYCSGLHGAIALDTRPFALTRRVLEFATGIVAPEAVSAAVAAQGCAGAWLPPIERLTHADDEAVAAACARMIRHLPVAPANPLIQVARVLEGVDCAPDLLDTIARYAATNANLCRQPRLLVDVTQLASADARSGIQRVVRSIARELAHANSLDRPFELVRLAHSSLWRASAVAAAIFDLEAAIPDQEIFIQPGDTLLMLDSSWEQYADFALIFQAIRQMGGKVVTVVYDLIPLLIPDLCSPGLTAVFQNWFAQAIAQSDQLQCISAAVADEVRVALQQRGMTHAVAVDHWRLGADITVTDCESSVREQVRTMAADHGSPLFLMVGTIEPRKGHDFALDAFDRLWRDGSDARLCIAGSIGWMVEDTVQRIRRHPQTGRKLFFIEQFTDAEIALCYQNASALIAASVAEGFGLPLVEAALHGLPVIASDIPVFREVGGDGATYFARDDPQALCNAIGDFLHLPVAEKTPVVRPVVTWRDSTALLLAAIGCCRH